jgi:hypothetical protein
MIVPHHETRKETRHRRISMDAYDTKAYNDIKASLDELDNRRRELDNERHRLHLKMEALCPLKKGDQIILTHENSYTHHGKTMIIHDIRYHERQYNNMHWIVSGPLIKKDGTPGINTGTAYI